MTLNGAKKRRSLIISMLVLAALIGGSVLATSAFTAYFRFQDPVNQCIQDPASQPFQLSVPITVIEDGFPARVPEGIGFADDCIRPVYTIEENLIQVSYSRPHNFTLGHFLYYWLGNDLLQYDTRVYVNDIPHTKGDLRDIILEDGNRIKIEFLSRR
jgi:hypothetical protein